MKRLLLLLLAAMLCTGCSALPGEERAFAVALGLAEHAGVWEASARVPTYQTGGGYLTLQARGNSLGEALALLNASAPMTLHYGQLRMLVFSRELAESDAFAGVMEALSSRGEVRQQAALCVAEDAPLDVLNAMEPATGSRLSKSLEAMVEARQQAGVLSEATLSQAQRAGERQQLVLLAAALESEAAGTAPGMDASAGEMPAKGGGKVQLAGGWLMGMDGRLTGSLTAMEMQLLSLLQGKLRQGTLSLPEGTVTLLDANSRVRLENQQVLCHVKVRYAAASMTEDGLRDALIRSLHSLSGKLAAAGCDALGIARQAIMGCQDMRQWHQLNWKEVYPTLQWSFTVEVEREA